MSNKSSKPFHVLYGATPAEGQARTFEIASKNEEACGTTQEAERLMRKLIADKRIQPAEGDILAVVQITRVKRLKVVEKMKPVDEDPNDIFAASPPANPAAATSNIELDDEDPQETAEDEESPEEDTEETPEKASESPQEETLDETSEDASEDNEGEEGGSDELEDAFGDVPEPEDDIVESTGGSGKEEPKAQPAEKPPFNEESETTEETKSEDEGSGGGDDLDELF